MRRVDSVSSRASSCSIAAVRCRVSCMIERSIGTSRVASALSYAFRFMLDCPPVRSLVRTQPDFLLRSQGLEPLPKALATAVEIGRRRSYRERLDIRERSANGFVGLVLDVCGG